MPARTTSDLEFAETFLLILGATDASVQTQAPGAMRRRVSEVHSLLTLGEVESGLLSLTIAPRAFARSPIARLLVVDVISRG